jgi:hypothetical protein
MIGTRFFEHFVKNVPAGGSSRLLAVSGSDKVISHGFALALLVFLLVVISLCALVEPSGSSSLRFPLSYSPPKMAPTASSLVA